MNDSRPTLKAIFAPSSRWQPVHDSYIPGTGPDPRALMRGLAEEGIEAEIVDQGEWPLNPLGRQAPAYASIDPLRAARIALGHRDADIVISVFEGAALSLVTVRRLFGFRTPIVIWDVSLTENWKTKERILDATIPKIANVFLLDSSQAPYVERRWKPRYTPLVVGHAADTDFYTPREGGGGGLLSVGDDIGRDFPTLLAAAEGLDAPVVIKSSLVSGATLPANVTVRRERLSYHALRDLYAAADVVVVPTHRTLNASGISSLLEAYAMGKAVIASDNPGIGDFLRHDDICLVVPPGDAEALRNAARRLLGDEALRTRLGRAARAFAEENCSMRHLARAMAGAVRTVVSETSR